MAMSEDRRCAGLVSYTHKALHDWQPTRCLRNGLDQLVGRWYCWQHVKQGQALERIQTRAEEILRAQGLLKDAAECVESQEKE